MTDKLPVSVYLITLNEEDKLADVLSKLTFATEIIVVDSGSTDKTQAIATAYGAKVIHQPWLGFAQQKAFAMNQCSQPWLLNLDGDEVLSKANIDSLHKILSNPQHDAYRLYFEDIFWGRPMSTYAGKRNIVRLFKRDVANYPTDRLVHENVKLTANATVGDVKGLVTHYGYNSTDQLMAKQNTYSTLKARQKYNSNKGPSLLKLLLVFPVTFVKVYLLKRQFLSGKRGLVVAYIDAMYAFLKEAKLFEQVATNSQQN
ncbi:glycosyltransferase family 2 protein [Alteromonas sp. C1M14]|uniref:glycosyltransferase family 2 protein n=1 Tax=Alteromonas sp. C1M14 TaxID=2841567 RepID=UPI001C0997A6|nr:glycosyltransferase family 2 protein [Alteromonas sp. C1M14]MBU2978145.1 glycosyltransferase family 2 protein [Alteromonas sp. C1M14]